MPKKTIIKLTYQAGKKAELIPFYPAGYPHVEILYPISGWGRTTFRFYDTNNEITLIHRDDVKEIRIVEKA